MRRRRGGGRIKFGLVCLNDALVENLKERVSSYGGDSDKTIGDVFQPDIRSLTIAHFSLLTTSPIVRSFVRSFVGNWVNY